MGPVVWAAWHNCAIWSQEDNRRLNYSVMLLRCQGHRMQSYYRDPQVEEGERNIVLQNRCGNRLTLLCHNDHCAFEFDYKPNAYRRKDYRARNFSNRDNHSRFFKQFVFPDITSHDIQHFDYDPFHTCMHVENAAAAKNEIHLINLAQQNAFVLSARCPLLIGIKPQRQFEASDGLLRESFSDRGEVIHTFIAFNSFEENRYRVLDDGTHVLQLMENDVLLVGAEETAYLAESVINTWKGKTLAAINEENEDVLSSALRHGHQKFTDAKWQQVFDINQRIVWSGLDQGGACFGALNRIYHLIWVRDGSMTANHFALAGNPDSVNIWAPFLLENPSRTLQEDATYREEFLQIVGSRWTKAEDDGLFYATWTMYTHFRSTGDDRLIHGNALPLLLRCAEAQLEKCWESERCLVGSDTLGEDVLAGSVYFGYDIVNGMIAKSHHFNDDDKQIERCYSLYHQVNTYNVLSMLGILLAQRPDLDSALAERFAQICADIQNSLRTVFCDEQNQLYSMYVRYDDGSDAWIPFGIGCDYWEHAWAVSQGPFFPVPDLQLKSARLVVDTWASYKPYGYCPWNVLARSLSEYGLETDRYAALLQTEIEEALHCPQKYPMAGALTEYAGAIEGWRALPFSAGSFLNSTAGQLLQSQAQGLCVRSGAAITAIENFRYRLSRIQVQSSGTQNKLAEYSLNDQTIRFSLQLAENLLLPGNNYVQVTRGDRPTFPRLFGSNAELLMYTESEHAAEMIFHSTIAMDLSFEQFDAERVRICDANGKALAFETTEMPESLISIVHVHDCTRVHVHISE